MKPCELCNGEASLYCSSDSAFLCWNCDANVHQANFIVARHLRRYLCSMCSSFTGRGFSGSGGYHYFTDTCPSCSPDDDMDSISSSSACISSTRSAAVDGGGIDCRHFRRYFCSTCSDFAGGGFCGSGGFRCFTDTCPSSSLLDSLSSSSACISTTGSAVEDGGDTNCIHFRRNICSTSGNFTGGGDSFHCFTDTCPSCSPIDDDLDSLSSSSSCISTS